jgi:hypothetical protein
VSRSHLALVRPEPGITPITVNGLLLDLALGEAQVTPAADAPDCRTHHSNSVVGYIVRQTRINGADADDRTMFPGADTRDVALEMVQSLCGQVGGWAVLDVVYSCGHWA